MSTEIYQKAAFMSWREVDNIINDNSSLKPFYIVKHSTFEDQNFLFASYDNAIIHLNFLKNEHIYISKDDNKDRWSIITIYEGFPLYGEIETKQLQCPHIISHF